jgi:hypothetical protein
MKPDFLRELYEHFHKSLFYIIPKKLINIYAWIKRRVVSNKTADVSDENIGSIFSVEE